MLLLLFLETDRQLGKFILGAYVGRPLVRYRRLADLYNQMVDLVQGYTEDDSPLQRKKIIDYLEKK